MKGSENLLATARAAGVEVCFANPGTTEIPLVEAFDALPDIRPVLGLSEGVVTGAADGYARMGPAPPLTLLHLGPGLANGVANLHNAYRANSPVINIIGEHTTWHQSADPPLASDIESLAGPVSGWVGRTGSAEQAPADFITAWQQALRRRLPATLIAPADHMWSPGGTPADVPSPPSLPAVDTRRVADVAKLLANSARDSFRPALLLGATALNRAGITAAARVAATFGGEVLSERAPARIDRAPDLPTPRELPYFPEDVLDALTGFTHLVLIGARTPVSFFGYRGLPSHPLPNGLETHTLAEPVEDATSAVQALAEATGSDAAHPDTGARTRVPTPEGELAPETIAAAIVHTQPENAIIVNEGVSAAGAYSAAAATAPAHTELGNTGGAIGLGPPLATGAAVACPDRPVINYQADGSAAYSIQALWTQAREDLNVTTIICANSRYRILQAELGRSGITEPGEAASGLTDLTEPRLDWLSLARGFGVAAVRVTNGTELTEALRTAYAATGPRLIEAVMP